MKNLKKSQQNSNIFWPSNIQKLKKSEHEEFVDKLVLASQSLKHRWLDKSSGQRTEICRWLIEGLYQSYFALPRSSLAIPLSKDAYSVGSPYEMPFSYRAVKDIVDASKETDFIEVVIGSYNPVPWQVVQNINRTGGQWHYSALTIFCCLQQCCSSLQIYIAPSQ